MTLAAEIAQTYFTPTRHTIGLLRDGAEVLTVERQPLRWQTVEARARGSVTFRFDAYTQFDAVGVYDGARLVQIDPAGGALAFPPGSEWTHNVSVNVSLVRL